MNARELAIQLEVSEATISRLLSGERRPSVDVMVAIRDRFPQWGLDSQAEALKMGMYGPILRGWMASESGA